MKFTVNIKEIHNLEVEVEANSVDDARDKAEELYSGVDFDKFDDLQYGHTLPKEDWTVCEVP